METIQTKSRKELEQIVQREFPAEQISAAMAVLEELKTTREKYRTTIQFNLVNLSRGSIEILRKQLQLANDSLAQPPQPVPKVTRHHVERVVLRDFPAEQFEQVMAILGEYGKEKWQPDVERVQLDILKLSNGNMNSIRKYIKEDYRDVISAAEYPECSKNWNTFKLSAEEQKKIYDKDWQQYTAWANAK